MKKAKKTARKKSFPKYFPKWLFISLLLLLGVRLLMPQIGLYLINKTLASKLGNYTGQIEDFDLSLHRGAYQLQGLIIKKKQNLKAPLLYVHEIDLSVAWRALLRKEITGDISIYKLQAHFTDSQDKNKKQNGTDEKSENWQSFLKVILPISIESLRVANSEVHFTNSDLKVPVVVKLDQIEFSAFDLRTRDTKTPSPIDLSARLQEHAKLKLDGKMLILADNPKADFNFQMSNFRVNTINKLLTAYIPIDVSGGVLDAYAEMAWQGKNATGYAKVFLKDGNILASNQEFKTFKHFIFELGSAFGNWLLKNSKSNTLATRIPFEYKAGKLVFNFDKALDSTLDNRQEKLPAGFDNSISFQNL